MEGAAGLGAASSAVMLTDTVPGGAVTQRDGLRHNCPVNSSQRALYAIAHGWKEDFFFVVTTACTAPLFG